MAAASVVVRLRHCIWREGRPRFQPGPRLRRLGYKGRDLRHPDGRWFALLDCQAFIEALEAEAASRGEARAAGRRLRKPPVAGSGPAGVSVAALVAEAFAAPDLRGQPVDDGRRRRKAAAASTIRWYMKLADVIADDHPMLWAAPAASVTPAVFEKVLEEIEAARGLATARGVRALLSRVWNRQGRRHGLVNPAAGLRLPMPAPRVRYGEVAEMRALIAAADRIGRADVGDMVVLGLFTGQRQNDRLAFTGQEVEGALLFRQIKTGAVVMVPALPQLAERLAAARRRRAGLKVDFPHVCIDERCGRPWTADHYRKQFRLAVREAEKAEPSICGFRDQDLRDTAVTWQALAGATVPEICAITGHSETSATQILRHYLGRHPDMAASGMEKLKAWLAAKAGGGV